MKALSKTTKIVLSVLGAVMFLLIVSLSVVCLSKNLFTGKVNTNKQYASAMSSIQGITKANPRVVDLAMLGSHDANTYALDKKLHGADGGTKKTLKNLYKLAPGISYRYTKTQVSNLYDQLCQGVRYVHLKAAYTESGWYGSHSLLDATLYSHIQEIIKFMQDYSGEIVVLQLQIMYGGPKKLANFIDDLFTMDFSGESLCDYIYYADTPLDSLRYNDVTQNGTKSGVVVLLSCENAIYSDDFWNVNDSNFTGNFYTRCFYAPWINRMKTSAIIDGINSEYSKITQDFDRFKNLFRVMQIVATPNSKDLFETTTAWSLVNKAKKQNIKILNNANFDKWLKVMPVVLCDFSTSNNGGFNDKINQKIIEYNIALVNG